MVIWDLIIHRLPSKVLACFHYLPVQVEMIPAVTGQQGELRRRSQEPRSSLDTAGFPDNAVIPSKRSGMSLGSCVVTTVLVI